MTVRTLLQFAVPLIVMSGLSSEGHAQQAHTQKANLEATVTVGNTRFTILTNRFVRMKWSDDRNFEDRALSIPIDRSIQRAVNHMHSLFEQIDRHPPDASTN